MKETQPGSWLGGLMEEGGREDCGGIMCFQIKSGVCIYQDMIVCVCVFVC